MLDYWCPPKIFGGLALKYEMIEMAVWRTRVSYGACHHRGWKDLAKHRPGHFRQQRNHDFSWPKKQVK